MAAKKKKKPSLQDLIAKEVRAALKGVAPEAQSGHAALAGHANIAEPAPKTPDHVQRVLRWWGEEQPLLRSAWKLSLDGGFDEATARSVIDALGDFYSRAHKNLYGEDPPTGLTPAKKSSGDPRLDAAEERMWRGG